jgi:hypothetical protein
MTKAALWPHIPDWGQRSAFVLPNSICFSALRDLVSASQLGKGDSALKFPAAIFDRESPKAACRNLCLLQQVTKVDSVAIEQYHAPPEWLIRVPWAKNAPRVPSRARRFPLCEVLSRVNLLLEFVSQVRLTPSLILFFERHSMRRFDLSENLQFDPSFLVNCRIVGMRIPLENYERDHPANGGQK